MLVTHTAEMFRMTVEDVFLIRNRALSRPAAWERRIAGRRHRANRRHPRRQGRRHRCFRKSIGEATAVDDIGVLFTGIEKNGSIADPFSPRR